VTVDRLGSMS